MIAKKHTDEFQIETFGPVETVVTVETVATPVTEPPRRSVRVMVPYGYPIFVHTQNISVRPGVEVTLEVDHFVEAQLQAGIFKEV